MLLSRRQFKQAWRPRRQLLSRRLGRPAVNRSAAAPAANFGSPKNIALIIFFSACLIWFAYFFIFSRHWAVRIVNIQGLTSIPSSELENIVNGFLGSRRAGVLPNRNILVFSKQGLQAVISQKYILDSLDINRELPWTLNITVKEKMARLVLRTVAKVEIAQAAEEPPNTASIAGDITDSSKEKEPAAPTFSLVTSYYYLDVNGIVVAAKDNIDEAELQALPVVEIVADSQTRVKPGDVVLSSDLVGYMFSVYEAAAKSSANIKIANLIYEPRADDEVKFLTTEGWEAFLSRKLSLDTQLAKLELALSEKIKEKRGQGLLYVDLRVKDRVYFK